MDRIRFGKRKGQFSRRRIAENIDRMHKIGDNNKCRKVVKDVPVIRKEPDSDNPTGDITPTRRGITELKQLGKELWCYGCKCPLSLRDIVSDSTKGVVRTLKVQCQHCKIIFNVDTCKSLLKNQHRIYDVNSKLAMGVVDSGMGCATINTVFSAMNMPSVTSGLFKRHERIIGPAVEEVANESCVANIRLEKELTLAAEREKQTNTSALDKSSVDSVSEDSGVGLSDVSGNLNNTSWDVTATSTPAAANQRTRKVALEAATDAGWHKKGSGRSYNSISGHNALIGNRSQGILAWSYRTRGCKNRRCKVGKPAPGHRCMKNWRGSSKAMEPDMAVEMTAKNDNLEKEGCYVGVLIGDDDSSTIAAVRRESDHFVEKWSDISHVKRSFRNALYGLNVDPTLIKYFTKCLNSAIRNNKGNPEAVEGSIRNIVNHAYGDHALCQQWGGKWCRYAENPTGFHHRALPNGKSLTNLELKGKLVKVLEKYARMADKLAPCASSQANESFNNMVAAKNPKTRHYGSSDSVVTRVAAAVAQKNLGTQYVLECNKKMALSPGEETSKYRAKFDSARNARRLADRSEEAVRKRWKYRSASIHSSEAAERREGVTYATGCDMDGIAHLVDDPAVQVCISPSEGAALVYVDLEATNRSRLTAEVCQIAALSGTQEFNDYMVPSKGISPGASLVTGLTVIQGQMFLNDQPVHTISHGLAWKNFVEYLCSLNRPVVLVAHNGNMYDFPIILREVNRFALMEQFTSVVKGLADTLLIFREKFRDQSKGKRSRSQQNEAECSGVMETPKEKQSFSLSRLAEKFGISNPDAHNALGDVRVLQNVVTAVGFSDVDIIGKSKPIKFIITNEHRLACKPSNVQSLQCLQSDISKSMINKLASNNLNMDKLKEAFTTGGEGAMKMILAEDIGGAPRITKQSRTIKKITDAVSRILAAEVA